MVYLTEKLREKKCRKKKYCLHEEDSSYKKLQVTKAKSDLYEKYFIYNSLLHMVCVD